MFRINLWILIQLLRWVNSSRQRSKIANGRSEKVVRKLDDLLVALHRAYQNVNCDIETNGEKRVLSIIAAANPKIIFDVGANKGDWANTIHGFNAQAQIHAFEPIAETFKLLQANAPFASAFPFGLGAKNERVKFGKGDLSECSSKYFATIGGEGVKAFEEIEIRKGDDFVSERQIPHIDYLKIDAEGMDYEVLQGFRKTIEEGKIDMIQFEYTKHNIQARSFLKDFYELLSPYYVIGKIYPTAVDFRGYYDDQEDFLQSNFIGVKKSLVEMVRKLKTADS